MRNDGLKSRVLDVGVLVRSCVYYVCRCFYRTDSFFFCSCTELVIAVFLCGHPLEWWTFGYDADLDLRFLSAVNSS